MACVISDDGAAKRRAPAGRSAGRPAIPPERIIAGALELVDTEGADALSMRSLAQHLGSGTATLYRHFSNRSQLIAHVVDLVLGEVALPPASSERSWQESVSAGAHASFAALARHPNVARLLLDQLPLGPNAMAIRERSLTNLIDNGFTPESAARVHATISRYVLGFAVQLSTQAGTDTAQAARAFQAVDPAKFPATLAAARAMPVPLETEFAFGLDLIIKGLNDIHRSVTTD
jgi:AcrR family transcriptional regulator